MSPSLLALTVSALLANAPLKVVPSASFEGIPESLAAVYSQRLAKELTTQGVRLVDALSLEQVPGLTAKRRELGCEEEPAHCPTAFAGVLGIEAVLHERLSSDGLLYTLQLTLLSTRDGSVLARIETTSADLIELMDLTAADARTLALEAGLHVGRALPVQFSLRPWSFVPLVAGIASASVGTVLLGVADAHARELSSLDPGERPIYAVDAFRLRETGEREQVAGAILLGVGGACMVGALMMYSLGDGPGAPAPGPDLRVAAGPTGLVLWGRLP